MDRPAALEKLRTNCNQIAALITQMHPAVPALSDAGAQGEILKALFEFTKQVEVVKKHLLRLEKGDGSSLV
ncbi:MAG: hypothetical protein RLZZ142_369 [Verrucomicrobiota bacterium]|jgi:hypothetical protein